MAKCDLSVELDRPRPTVRGGQSITGHVVVQVDKACRCDGLMVAPRLRVHGRGNRFQDSYTGQVVFAGEWSPGEYRYPFRVTAPNGPQSYDGGLTNVEWSVAARADIPWAFDPKADAVFRLAAGPPETYSTGNIAISTASATGWTEYTRLGCTVFMLAPFLTLGVVSLFEFSRHGGSINLVFGTVCILFGAVIAAFGARKYIARDKLGRVDIRAPEAIRAGDEVEVSIAFTPKPGTVLKDITASLKAGERAVSGSGTNKTTHRATVLEMSDSVEIGRAFGNLQPQSHTFKFQTRRNAPTSFAVPNNSLGWTISLCVAIEGWPDYQHTQALLVAPPIDSEELRLG